MAGPIDCRVNPTKVNDLANSKTIDWFEQNLIARVPFRYPGAFRQVYPGFVQLAAFLSMNIERHLKAHRELYENLRLGELEKAEVTKKFYDEYFAVLDLSADFYLETVQWVFQEHELPAGTMKFRGQTVEPKAIRHERRWLTVEGEKDDICAVGQTSAAHDLCSSLRPYRASVTICRPGSVITACSAASAGTADLSVGEERDFIERVNGFSHGALLPPRAFCAGEICGERSKTADGDGLGNLGLARCIRGGGMPCPWCWA